MTIKSRVFVERLKFSKSSDTKLAIDSLKRTSRRW